MMPDQDDYLGHSYSDEWRPPCDPRTDPTLEFVGYEDDQPVWRKKPKHSVVVDGVVYVPAG
jgi:hypothetical protein